MKDSFVGIYRQSDVNVEMIYFPEHIRQTVSCGSIKLPATQILSGDMGVVNFDFAAASRGKRKKR